MKVLKMLMVACLVFFVSACSSTYKFGDLSKSYCGSTSPEFRAVVKSTLAGEGVIVGIGYCDIRGLIDMIMVDNDKEAINVIDQYDYGPTVMTKPDEGFLDNLMANLAVKQNLNFERMYNY